MPNPRLRARKQTELSLLLRILRCFCPRQSVAGDFAGQRHVANDTFADDFPPFFLHGLLCRVLCCVLAALWAVPASGGQPPVRPDQEVLIELKRGWNEAFHRQDVAFIEGLLADEFTATYDDGSRGDKAGELALTAEFNQQVLPAIQEDFTVRVYRETAVLWFTMRLVGIRQGERAEVMFRYTDVWVLRDGRWQCVSTQSTKIDPQ